MQHPAAPGSEGLILESVVTSKTGMLRLCTGLAQGLLLYFLYRATKSEAWPATERMLFAPVLLAALIAPVLLISSLGHLERRRIVGWMGLSLAVIAGLGFYDVWRGDASHLFGAISGEDVHIRYPSPLLFVFLVAGFFIAQSLVISAAHDRRRVASYATHFEVAWKLLIQLAFSAAFVSALWAALWLGAMLFMLVKLDFLKELLQQSWFSIPVTAFGFACAIHLTDVRPAIVRGIRSLLLMLMSWILPVTTLIVVGFLASLPVTGLAPLWATKSATAVLLFAAATLVVLINAAYQNGQVAANVSRIIRMAAHVAALALTPLAAIAVYALGLRVAEYGWTSDRVIAAACLLVAFCYALSYARAVFQRNGWLPAIAPANVATAYVVLAVLLAMFSPLADPARLSVNNQVQRLLSGTIPAEQFDFEYLRFNGVRYGQVALEQLQAHAVGPQAAVIRAKAQQMLAQARPSPRGTVTASAADVAKNVVVGLKRPALPPSFLQQNWSAYQRSWELPSCLHQAGQACDALAVDLDGDNREEVVLLPQQPHQPPVVMARQASGSWEYTGHLPVLLNTCRALRDQLLAGEYRLVAPAVKDIEVGGQRIAIDRRQSIANVKCEEVR